MHEEPVGGGAGLAHVAHLREHRAVDGRVDVGVVEDQERRVAAQLHADPLELVGGLLDQLLPDPGGAGEAHLAQPRVGHDRGADLLGAGRRDDVEHAVRQPRLGERRGEGQHRQRRLLGGLDDHRAAGGDGRADLAGAHGEREVPGRHEEAGADRLLDGQQPAAAGRGLHPAAVDAHRLLGEPAQELVAVGHLAGGLLERLAHLEAHQRGELVAARGHQLEGAPQDLAPLAGRGARPAVLGRHRGLEGPLPVGHRGVGHLAEHGPVGGVEHVEAATTLGVAPLAADEQAPLVVGKEVQTGHGGHFLTGTKDMTAGAGLCLSIRVDFGGSTAKSARAPR